MMLAASDFRRHGKMSKWQGGVQKEKRRPPAGSSRQRPDAPLAHLDLAIPRRVASQQGPTPLRQAQSLYDNRGVSEAPPEKSQENASCSSAVASALLLRKKRPSWTQGQSELCHGLGLVCRA